MPSCWGIWVPPAFSRPESRWIAVENLLLTVTLALSSNWAFRIWNLLALLVLLPVQAISLSGAARFPWRRPAMFWDRLGLLLWGLFGRLGASFAALSRPKQGKRTAGIVLGIVGSVVLLAILVRYSPLPTHSLPPPPHSCASSWRSM